MKPTLMMPLSLCCCFILLAPLAHAESNAWNKAWQSTKQAGSDAWQATKHTSSQVWDTTKDASSEVWGETKEVSSKAWDGTKEVSSEVWGTTKETSKSAWQETKQVVNSNQTSSSSKRQPSPAKPASTNSIKNHDASVEVIEVDWPE